MVDDLQRLFVPKQDGGVFTPLISYGSVLLTDYSRGWFGGSDNRIDRGPSVGVALADWYFGRAAAQIPQFVGAAVWMLITLIALVCIAVLATWQRRLPCSPNRHGKRLPPPADQYAVSNPSPTPSSDSLALSAAKSSRWWRRRRREKLMALRLGLLVAVFAVCTATLGVYWNYSGGYGFGRLFQRQQKASDSGGGRGTERLRGHPDQHPPASCRSAMAFPRIEPLSRPAVGRFPLTPLLNSFDKFLNLKLLLASMNAIKSSRDSVLNPLNSFTTMINRTREDLRAKVADVCAGSPTNGVPVALCDGVNRYIGLLYIGLDSRRIDSDSSVTIVTLLDKIFKLNVTEVEAQVNSAKSLLTGSLSLIGDEITNLFNTLVDEVSKQFKSAVSGAEQLGSEMVNMTQSESFVGAFNTGDTVLQIISAVIVIAFCLTLACVAVISILLVYFYYQRNRWEAASNSRQMGGEGPPAGFEETPGEQQSRPPPLRSFASIVENHAETLTRQKQDQSARELRHLRKMNRGMRLMKTNPMIRVMCALGACFALLFACGFALLYAGSMIQQDACTYFTLPASTAVVDKQLDRMIDDDLWPVVQRLLAEKIEFPVPLTQSMLPKGLLGVLLRDCKNSSATIFQIYNLLVGDLDASTLIPSEVDSILAVLPEFANIIDTQDFSASIAELSKPLLAIGDRLPLLFGDLQAMVRILLDRNPSDNRAILIQHFADNLNGMYTSDYPALNGSLNEMKRHFLTLQNNRLVMNLTVEVTARLAELKVALSNRTALLTAVATRYDQVLSEYTPELAATLNSLLSKILTRIGRCSGLSSVLETVVTECSGSLSALPYGGFYVALSCALLVLLSIFAMPVLRAARWHKRAVAEQVTWSASTKASTFETSADADPDQRGLNGTII
uniref:Plasma membrane fusion protein PRM1 n=1 Tax=Macrostomum lignano TaxID=282301 RepID=A0A1I8GBX7_9PLAT